MRLPARHERVPELEAALGAERVDLVSRLLAPAGVGDDARHGCDVHGGAVEAPEGGEVAVVERLEHRCGERPLELQRRDIRFLDLDSRAASEREAVGPQRDVRVRMRVPDGVLEGSQHDAVGHDLAVLVADRREPAAPDRQVEQIARTEVVGEAQRVGTAQLRLALGADVPERHPLRDRPILDDRVAPIVERHVRVVVDHEPDRAGGKRAIEVRRPAHAVGERLAPPRRTGRAHTSGAVSKYSVAARCARPVARSQSRTGNPCALRRRRAQSGTCPRRARGRRARARC